MGWWAVLETVVSALIGVVACAFAVGASLKVIVWWKSLRWALAHGHDYAEAVQSQDGPVTRDMRLQLIVEHNGNFRPLGAKSVNLWNRRPTAWSRALDIAFVKTPFFILEAAIFALLASLAPFKMAKIAAVVVAAWVCVYSLMLIVEAIVWYVIAKDYSLVWGDIKFSGTARNHSSKTLGDFKGLGAVTLNAGLACSILISVVVQTFQGYEGIEPSPTEQLGFPTLISSTYYVVATLSTVGDGNIAPLSPLARATAALLDLMVLLTITFAVSALTARMQTQQ